MGTENQSFSISSLESTNLAIYLRLTHSTNIFSDVPLPFTSSSNEPVFSSTKEKSSIPVEKSDVVAMEFGSQGASLGAGGTTCTPAKNTPDEKNSSPVKVHHYRDLNYVYIKYRFVVYYSWRN